MAQEQPVSITLYNGENIIQLMGDGGGNVPFRIEQLIRFKQGGWIFLGGLFERHGCRKATYTPAATQTEMGFPRIDTGNLSPAVRPICKTGQTVPKQDKK